MQVGAFEGKNTLGALLDRAEQGEEVIIARHGKPVARLAPCTTPLDRDSAKAALDRIRFRARGWLSGHPWETLKANRDAGRP